MPPKKKRRNVASRRRPDQVPSATENLITRADAARLRNVSRAAVTQLCRPGGGLYDAVRGKLLDRSSPAFREWLTAGEDATASEVRDLMLRKRRAEIERIESRNHRDAELLISRELVSRNVFSHLQQLHLRLLHDVPRTLATTLTAAVRTGEPRETIEELIQATISTELAAAKAWIAKGLWNCAAGDRPPETTDRPSPAGDPNAGAALAKFVARVRKRMRERAAPKVLAVTLQEIARAAAGAHWNEERFTEVMSTKPAIDAEALSIIAGILEAHVPAADIDDVPLNEETPES
jgi:hypothetical protein